MCNVQRHHILFEMWIAKLDEPSNPPQSQSRFNDTSDRVYQFCTFSFRSSRKSKEIGVVQGCSQKTDTYVLQFSRNQTLQG